MDARGQFWVNPHRMRPSSSGASYAGILLPSSTRLLTNLPGALTQDYVARFLISNHSKAGVRVPQVYAAFLREDTSVCTTGYIVMQYIDAPDCGERDHLMVAKAAFSSTGRQK
ncbi:hypothetical protein BGY98DRAFT_1178924 [Russula aff. rugulosa BPL654]|nr:hypothetical protein BGY98DRAFT_1178924 [Russula aff. rugulosa BPL654]